MRKFFGFTGLSRLIASGIFLAGVTATGMAQNTTEGAISGTVFDATDAAVPGATILIHNNGTNADLTLVSDGSGFFKAQSLAPGTYTVTFNANGFREVRTSQVIVQLSQITELNQHLTTGGENAVIEVTADAPVLKFDTPVYGGLLSNNEIENIPINNRRWSSLALLTPGTTNDSQGFGLIAFRAIQPQLNNVQIDGTDDNQVFYGEERGRTRAGYSTAQTAIREFQVNSGVYSAEFGRAVGGVINSVTKSGTNEIHGEVYFYHRDSQWSAANAYTNRVNYDPTTGIATRSGFKAKDKRNQFGFGVGGPLIKDKLFGFYAFDQFRRTFPGFGTASQLAFFNPLSASTTAGGVTTANSGTSDAAVLARSIYLTTGNASYNPGATAGGVSANPAALALSQQAYNNLLGAANGALGQVSRFGNQTINTPKIDWQISGKHHATFLYHRLRWDSPGGIQTQANVFYSREGFGNDFVKLDYGVAKLDSLITSSLTNEIRFQYGRELNDESALPNTDFTNRFLENSSTIAPQVNLNTSVGFIAGQPYYAFRPALPDERKWQVADSAGKQFGRHSVKFGIDVVHNYDLQATIGGSGSSPNGTFSYSTNRAFAQDILSRPGVINGASATLGTATIGRGTGGCGTQTAATTPGTYVPVGCYSTYGQTLSPTPFTATNTGGTPYDITTIDYGAFVQDDWKITPRLTLNLGARYDIETISDVPGNLVNAAVTNTSNHFSDKNNIAPRLGFAWDPYGLGKTVVRGGFGLYYGRVPNVAILGAHISSGSPNGQLAYSYTPTSANAPLFAERPSTFLQQPTNIQYIDSHFQNPYTEQFDLAVQQNIGLNTVLSVTYLGALGRELPNSINKNLDPSKAYTANYTVVAGSDGTCGKLTCGSVIQSKVYPQRVITNGNTIAATSAGLNTNYNGVYDGVSNITSNYHALTVEMQKRASKYISYDANYTWSHALDYNQTSITAFTFNNSYDPFSNPRANYGNSYLDVRHRAVGWMIFNIPGARSSNGFVKALTNGYSIKPAVQVQSGLPYSATLNGTTAPSNGLTTLTAANVGVYQATQSGLSGLGVTYIPQVGRNTYNYPRDIVVDLRLQKDFKISDRFNFQVLGEAFNLANHQNVTSLSTTGYNLTSTTAANPTAANPNPASGTLTYQSRTATGGFGFVNSSNSNFAYTDRKIQVGGRLFF